MTNEKLKVFDFCCVFLLFAFCVFTLEEGLLDDFGNDKPGDDSQSPAEHIIMMVTPQIIR